jgi:glycosyltransferase involved in cell wall biosynthesis
MRVLLMTDAQGLGGVTRHVLELGAGLRDRGVTVSLELPRDAHAVRGAAAERGLPVSAPGGAPSVDVAHYHLANTFNRAALADMLRRKRSARIVVTEHLPHTNASDPALPYAGGRSAAVIKTAFKRAQLAMTDRTIVLSQSCLGFMTRRYRTRADRIRIVPNGIPAPTVPSPRRLNGPRVVAAGSLIVQKGFEVLVRAAAGNPTFHVEIFGDGPSRPRLERLAAELGAPVRLAGWGGPADIDLESAAVVCIPSLWEALPYVALEAMWAGAPIVASRVDGLQELVAEGETGLLVEPGDPVGLAAALERVVSEPGYGERLGQAGRERAARRFPYEAMVNGVLGVYRELCAA